MVTVDVIIIVVVIVVVVNMVVVTERIDKICWAVNMGRTVRG